MKRLGAVAVSSGLVLGLPVAVQASPPDHPVKVSNYAPMDPTAEVTFYLGLKRNDNEAIRQLKRRSNPKHTYYRHWLSQKKVAKKYGASAATVAQLSGYLAARGISVNLDKSGVFARITGQVQTIETTFGSPIIYEDANNIRYIAALPSQPPVVPQEIQSVVQEVAFYALQQLPAVSALSAQSNVGASPAGSVPAPVNEGIPIGACEQVKSDPNLMTFEQAAKAYTIDKVRAKLGYGLKKKGDLRKPKAPTAGIIGGGQGFSQVAADVSANCLGWGAKPGRVVMTDGMLTPLPAGQEGDLDLQMISAMVRRTTKITTYERIMDPPTAFLALYAALNDPKLPSVLSTSYGQCEIGLNQPEDVPVVQLYESALMRLALVGTTVFVAAGDVGSSGCMRTSTDSQLAAVYPATSRYVTAVGGTRLVLDKANRRADEVVWNDSAFVGGNFANNPGSAQEAGSGGTSILFKRPWWQDASSAANRTVPDISVHGSGAPAWPIFETPGTSGDGLQNVWGSSSSAPLVAAAFALINAQERTEGQPNLGFINPWLYSIKKPYRNGFFDVVSGNNDLYNVGCCTARRGYDQASGIGVPKFAKLQQLVVPKGVRKRR